MSRYFTFGRFLAITAFLILLSGCKTPQTIYLPVYVTDSTATATHDTQREKDSVIVERETIIREADSALLTQLGIMGVKVSENEKVILVLRNELLQKIQQLEQAKSDTLIKYKDTPVPYPVEKEVEKPLTKWQQFRMSLGTIAIIAAAVCLLFLCFRLWQKIKKN